MHFMKISILFIILFQLSYCQHIPKYKLFNSMKHGKVDKSKLSLIIHKLKPNETVPILEVCPRFMKYSSCTCEPTCDIPKPICSFCKKGCICRGGLVKNRENQCVLPEQCHTGSQIFELPPTTRLYEALPVTVTTTVKPQLETTTEEIERETILENEFVTQPLIILRSGPTPPSAPPMLRTAHVDREMIGAPSATPPPDFFYGPPGMNTARFSLYEDYLKQKRIRNALLRRRARFLFSKL